ncbi:MAG: endonuclease/exonuclease/phosphatase family protein [Actinocatenispora sp.]
MVTNRRMGEAPVHTPERGQSRRRGVRGRDLVLVAASLLVAALLAGHRLVPAAGGLGTLVDSFLPWLGVLVLPLALAALLARSRLGLVALLAPVLVWSVTFGAAFLPQRAGTGQFRVVSQNVDADNTQPATTAADLANTRAGLVAVQELNSQVVPQVLDRTYRHHVTVGTVGLWSRYPITRTGPVDLGLGWNRALRAQVDTEWGQLAVYVVHLASVRPGVDGMRDRTLSRLTSQVRQDPAAHLLVLGDLNTASTDRQLGQLVPPLHDAQRDAGWGLGFTWPTQFPVTRPDQLLYRGLTATSASVIRTAGSDHRATTAEFRLAS